MQIEMDGKVVNSHVDSFLDGALVLEVDERDQDDEEARREMARILKELKQKHPEKEIEQLIELANYQVLSQQQKVGHLPQHSSYPPDDWSGNILKRHAADQPGKPQRCMRSTRKWLKMTLSVRSSLNKGHISVWRTAAQ